VTNSRTFPDRQYSIARDRCVIARLMTCENGNTIRVIEPLRDDTHP
jgi:hypothetical protein